MIILFQKQRSERKKREAKCKEFSRCFPTTCSGADAGDALKGDIMKAAIIGCGKIAQVRHIPEYCANPQVTLAGYYDANLDRAKELAETYGGKAYGSQESLLADPSIDAVSVCVSNDAHARVTIAALEAGKHVLCEKTMATRLEDCEEMVRAAEKSGKNLMIDQNQRFAGAHRKAKELLKQGMIGDVITFRICFGHGGPEAWSIDAGRENWFFDENRARMGAMVDLDVHKIDLIQFLLGAAVKETTAKIVTLNKRDEDNHLIKVDDNAICILVMDNGAVGTVTASWTYYGEEDNSTVLYGTDGIMKIYYGHAQHTIMVNRNNGEKIFYDIDRIQTNERQTNSGIIDAFVQSVIRGERPPIDGSDVLSAMKAVFASVKSGREGRAVRVESCR